MKVIYSCFLTALAVLAIGCATQKPLNFDLVISNVNIIDVETGDINKAMDVIISGDSIANIVVHQDGGYNAPEIVDGTDKFLIPGLWDMHAHANDYHSDFPKFIHYGVTGVFITGGSTCTNGYYSEMRAMNSQDTIPSPRVFHTSQHFIKEGSHPVKTYENSSWKEGETVFYLKDTLQIERLVKQVTQYPIEGIKLTIEDGPDPPFIERVSQVFINKVQKEAAKQGTRVFAHISDNTELEMALDAGIYNFVHFTGVDLDFEKDKALISKIYANPINWVTTFMLDKSFIYPLYPDWITTIETEAIFDSTSFKRIKDPSYIARANSYISLMKEYLKMDTITLKDVIKFQVDDIKELHNNGINMVLGTDTGNTFIYPGHSIHEEMQLLELGGMPPADILKMCTLNAAIMLRVQDSLGSVEVGKIADMVLLDKNPLESISNTLKINSVFKNGKIQTRIK